MAPLGDAPAWLPERIVRHDDSWLVVDKPHGVPVHGGGAAGVGDVVGRLSRYLRDQGEADYLGVHQRLDQGASGVLLFTRREAVNRELGEDFAEHRLERVYRALVTPQGNLPARGSLSHRLSYDRRRGAQVVARGGKVAHADYRVLEQSEHATLLELRPSTGRTHQLRVQLGAIGAPIVGDAQYGGLLAPRLMLHACELTLTRTGDHFAAAVPRVFADWLAHGAYTLPDDLAPALREACWRRNGLGATTSAYRLVNAEGDELPGVTVDVYGHASNAGEALGSWAVLSIARDAAAKREAELAQALIDIGVRGVYVKRRRKADLRHQALSELAPAAPVLGEPAPDRVVVREGPLSLAVRLADGLSTGLFVDQRDNRDRVRRLSCDQRVLNLFCYTGSFSAAAALGGAKQVLSVDLSGRALERVRENLELNGIEAGLHPTIKADAIKWLERAHAGRDRFSLVILDPPSFATVGKQTFSVPKHYELVAAGALALLETGGHLLAVTNHQKTSVEAFRRLLHRAARRAGVSISQMKTLASGLDYPPNGFGPHPSKSLLVTVS